MVSPAANNDNDVSQSGATRAAPQSLPPELFQRSDAKGLTRLAAHAGILLLTFIALRASLGTLWAVPAIVLHGVALIFLFSALHECIHGTAFRTRWINDTVAFACGVLLLLPREYFRAFHLGHHRHTQDPERDPELAYPKPGSLRDYVIELSGFHYWREHIRLMFRHAGGTVDETFIAERARPAIAREARLHLVLYAAAAAISMAASSYALAVYWILPLLLGQPFLRAFLLAEHTGCPFVPDMLVNTRTTLTRQAVRFLTWNMPYHAEHHAWAAIPFHALPKAHAIAKDDVVHKAPGYVSVHGDLVRSFRPASVE